MSLVLACALIAAVLVGQAGAQAVEDAPLTLDPWSIEAGLAASLSRGESATRADAMLRVGTFMATGTGRAGTEVELGYGHLQSLDWLDVLWNVSWQWPQASAAVWPYAAFAGGVRQEWLGSFREGRFPVGGHVGIRTLFSRRVGLRVEYRYHRVLGDAVADFDEHLLSVGLSVLFRNGSSP